MRLMEGRLMEGGGRLMEEGYIFNIFKTYSRSGMGYTAQQMVREGTQP